VARTDEPAQLHLTRVRNRERDHDDKERDQRERPGVEARVMTVATQTRAAGLDGFGFDRFGCRCRLRGRRFGLHLDSFMTGSGIDAPHARRCDLLNYRCDRVTNKQLGREGPFRRHVRDVPRLLQAFRSSVHCELESFVTKASTDGALASSLSVG